MNGITPLKNMTVVSARVFSVPLRCQAIETELLKSLNSNCFTSIHAKVVKYFKTYGELILKRIMVDNQMKRQTP